MSLGATAFGVLFWGVLLLVVAVLLFVAWGLLAGRGGAHGGGG